MDVVSVVFFSIVGAFALLLAIVYFLAETEDSRMNRRAMRSSKNLNPHWKAEYASDRLTRAELLREPNFGLPIDAVEAIRTGLAQIPRDDDLRWETFTETTAKLDVVLTVRLISLLSSQPEPLSERTVNLTANRPSSKHFRQAKETTMDEVVNPTLEWARQVARRPPEVGPGDYRLI